MPEGDANPQPPPLPGPVTNGEWNKVAAVAGALIYVLVLYRFQTYTERNHMPSLTFIIFSGTMFLAGYGLGLVATASPTRAASFLILGVWTAHAVVIAVDVREDPTNHNLLPFEFIYLGVLGSPAYLGSLLSRFTRRQRSS